MLVLNVVRLSGPSLAPPQIKQSTAHGLRAPAWVVACAPRVKCVRRLAYAVERLHVLECLAASMVRPSWAYRGGGHAGILGAVGVWTCCNSACWTLGLWVCVAAVSMVLLSVTTAGYDTAMLFQCCSGSQVLDLLLYCCTAVQQR